jgi:hypothetical protein
MVDNELYDDTTMHYITQTLNEGPTTEATQAHTHWHARGWRGKWYVRVCM